MRLKKLLESSARDRLKKKVKSSLDSNEIRGQYLGRITRLYNKNPSGLEFNYKRFIENYVKHVRVEKDYTLGLLGLFNMVYLGIDFPRIKYPPNLEQAVVKLDSEMDIVMERNRIPEKFNLKTIAFFLQLLEEHGFKLQET